MCDCLNSSATRIAQGIMEIFFTVSSEKDQRPLTTNLTLLLPPPFSTHTHTHTLSLSLSHSLSLSLCRNYR